MITEKERNSLIKFIYSREQPEGGFSFSHMTPPTLEDTYFALRLLEELDQRSVNKPTVSYIQSLSPVDMHLPKHLYQLTTIYRIAHLQNQINLLQQTIFTRPKINLNTLADFYYTVLTKELLHMLITINGHEYQLLTSVENQPVKSIEEYHQLITLMKKIQIPFKSDEYSQRIRAVQNHDGGFGLVLHSTSYLEPTYHALQALKELHAAPGNTDECERFVYSCMTQISGFGRQITTVPSIEYSYYGVVSLKIIDMMKKIEG